ncbi:MAG: thioredoxin family protein [bacterium]|nr:thioredoxin family protein [bacterium]
MKISKTSFLFLMTALSTIVFSACTGNGSDIQSTVIDEDTAIAHETGEMMMEDEMMELPGELSESEKTKYKSDLPISEKIALAEEISMHMPKNGFDQLKTMLPDLEKVTDIENEDSRNMMKAGLESWYYSQEADITIAICTGANSPLHVFKGGNPSETEVKEAIQMMHDMMEGDMMMEVEESASLEKAQYLTYSKSKYDELIGKEPMVLFFHAQWCSTCLGLEADIKDDLANFPDGTKIIQVDFDTELGLRKEYGINVQSSLIVLDGEGNVRSALLAPSIRDLKSAIKQTI